MLHYFPTQVGAKWVYQQGAEEYSEAVTAVEDKYGGKLVTVERTWKDRKANLRWQMLVSARGLFEAKGIGHPETRGFILIMLPRAPSAHFTPFEGSPEGWIAGSQFSTFVFTRSARPPERVRVPAGEFETLPVEERVVKLEFPATPNRGVTSVSWYALGVGLVKKVSHGEETVLKSFTPGKD